MSAAPRRTVLISAADASGDLHAAALARALRRRAPEVRVLALGGAALANAGAELVVEQRELAIGGLRFGARDVLRVVRAWFRMKRALREFAPALVVLVDAPDFNIPFAARARASGARVLYYISPQVWAWRRGRIRKLARRVDRMAVIFPFEVEVYANSGLRAEFVGHPLLDRLRKFCETHSKAACRRELAQGDARPLVALLPGSRRNELRRMLPLFLEVARTLHARDPRIAFALALAPSIERAFFDALLARETLPPTLELSVHSERRYSLLRAADVALAKPGTGTLESALLETPLVVAGRTGLVTEWVTRWLLRVSHYAMPNLIAGRRIAPEFVHREARPPAIASAVQAQLHGGARAAQLGALAEVGRKLGGGGAAERTAEIALELLREPART